MAVARQKLAVTKKSSKGEIEVFGGWSLERWTSKAGKQGVSIVCPEAKSCFVDGMLADRAAVLWNAISANEEDAIEYVESTNSFHNESLKRQLAGMLNDPDNFLSAFQRAREIEADIVKEEKQKEEPAKSEPAPARAPLARAKLAVASTGPLRDSVERALQ